VWHVYEVATVCLLVLSPVVFGAVSEFVDEIEDALHLRPE